MSKGKEQEIAVWFFPPCVRGNKPPSQVLYEGCLRPIGEVVQLALKTKLHPERKKALGGGQFYIGYVKDYDPEKIGGKLTWWGVDEKRSGLLQVFLTEALKKFFEKEGLLPSAEGVVATA